ncbi:hypothetical protein jhhlp_008648 [Lomentospora prolificans]|uniref:MARVEL domain-containing protein n=1 Tax=Lomentospora prolificans TaxID=41688 RepID=A0A2N3MYM1_9PEZI|nr:hypothetical protein jhhlp_008648 [Lomentospora prolificans]
MALGPALKTLQMALRSLQLTGALVILAIYSYTLGALANRGLSTPTFVRAVEGIAGITIAYTIACMVATRFFAGRTFPSFINMIFDVAFAAAFIYVAVANRGGAGSCSGEVDTAFGKGKSADKVDDGGNGGFMALPKYADACRLLTACLAIAILMIFMFIASIATSLYLGRNHHREKRQTLSQEPLKDSSYPGSYPSDHTADDGNPFAQPAPAKKGWFRSLFSRNVKPQPLVDRRTAENDASRPGRGGGVGGDDDYVHVAERTRPTAPGGYAMVQVSPEQRFGAESDLGLASDRRFGTQGYERIPLNNSSPHHTQEYAEVSPIDDRPMPYASPARPSPYSDTGFRPSPGHYNSNGNGNGNQHRPSLPHLVAGTYHPPSSTVGHTSSSTQLGEIRQSPSSDIYFPTGPYENLRPVSRDPRATRSQVQLAGRPAHPVQSPPAYRYSDGVYDV